MQTQAGIIGNGPISRLALCKLSSADACCPCAHVMVMAKRSAFMTDAAIQTRTSLVSLPRPQAFQSNMKYACSIWFRVEPSRQWLLMLKGAPGQEPGCRYTSDDG